MILFFGIPIIIIMATVFITVNVLACKYTGTDTSHLSDVADASVCFWKLLVIFVRTQNRITRILKFFYCEGEDSKNIPVTRCSCHMNVQC